jgi:hypothetical protein
MTGDLRAGLAQWTPGRDPDVNLRKAEAALLELARRGCQLAVLPELWLCGYPAVTAPVPRSPSSPAAARRDSIPAGSRGGRGSPRIREGLRPPGVQGNAQIGRGRKFRA